MGNVCSAFYGIIPLNDSLGVLKSYNCIQYDSVATDIYAGVKMSFYNLQTGKQLYVDSDNYYGNIFDQSYLKKIPSGYVSMGGGGLTVLIVLI